MTTPRRSSPIGTEWGSILMSAQSIAGYHDHADDVVLEVINGGQCPEARREDPASTVPHVSPVGLTQGVSRKVPAAPRRAPVWRPRW